MPHVSLSGMLPYLDCSSLPWVQVVSSLVWRLSEETSSSFRNRRGSCSHSSSSFTSASIWDRWFRHSSPQSSDKTCIVSVKTHVTHWLLVSQLFWCLSQPSSWSWESLSMLWKSRKETSSLTFAVASRYDQGNLKLLYEKKEDYG